MQTNDMAERLVSGTSSSLTIRLFGPLDVRLSGDPIPRLRSRKGEWLLALLTLRQDREVERAWLAGNLWPESSACRALFYLRRELFHLRQALGREAIRLRSPRPHTLYLDLTGAAADLVAFDAAIARGGTAGRSEVVRTSLEEAVSLYRGPLLEGCAEEWVLPEREAREQAYVSALEALAALASQQSDSSLAVHYLRRAVAEDPLRETAHRSLMQTLAARGEYAAAALVYRELRLLLHRELNAEPAPETTVLFQQIRAAVKGGARCSVLGPRLDNSVLIPAEHRAPSTEHLSSRIPRPLTRLIGREDEVRAAKVNLRTARLVTLTGIGGVGKSRLAIQIAEELANDYRDGAWFVELGSLADPAAVPSAVASVLGVREATGSAPRRAAPSRSLASARRAAGTRLPRVRSACGGYSAASRPLGVPRAPGGDDSAGGAALGGRARPETLLEFLREKQLLLVLDNCEHLLESCAPLAEELLRGCPDLSILATSRQTLGLTGEVAWQVPALAAPDPRHWSVIRSHWSGTHSASRSDRQLPTPADLVSALMEYPAIQLFVERARQAQPSFAVSPETLQAAVQLCYQLDGIPLAIELAAARVKALSVQQMVARLDDRFRLLSRTSRVTVPRHQALQATLDWSYRLLVEPEQLLLHRLSVFAGGWALEAAEAICAPDEVLDHLTALVDKSLVIYEEGEREGRYRLLGTVRQYAAERLLEHGESETVRRRHLEYFLQLAEENAPHRPRASHEEWLDRMEREHDNLRTALAWGERDGHCAELGLRLAIALRRFWELRGYWTEGREALDRALARSPKAAVALRVRALLAAGALAYRLADHRRANELTRQSLALSQEGDDLRGRADALLLLGNLAWAEGQYAQARACYEESLVLWREIGDLYGTAGALGGLGLVAQTQGDYAAAQTCYSESGAILREIGDTRAVAQSLYRLGSLAVLQGDPARALTQLGESLVLFRGIGERSAVAFLLYHLGSARRAQSDTDGARPHFEESLMIAQEIEDRWATAASLAGLGHLAQARGEDELARRLFRDGLAIFQQIGSKPAIAECLVGLAAVAAKHGEPQRAARLLGAAEGLRRAIGASLAPVARADHECAVAAVRAALGETAFAAAWEAGQECTPEETIAEALQGQSDGPPDRPT